VPPAPPAPAQHPAVALAPPPPPPSPVPVSSQAPAQSPTPSSSPTAAAAPSPGQAALAGAPQSTTKVQAATIDGSRGPAVRDSHPMTRLEPRRSGLDSSTLLAVETGAALGFGWLGFALGRRRRRELARARSDR
jgi:hypothetical protein